MQLIFNERNIITPYQRFLQKQKFHGNNEYVTYGLRERPEIRILQSEIAGKAKWKHSN